MVQGVFELNCPWELKLILGVKELYWIAKMSSSQRHSQSFKSSIDGLMNVFMNLKKTSAGQQDKPMQSALQNVVIIAVIGAVVGVCFVLGPFLKVSTLFY